MGGHYPSNKGRTNNYPDSLKESKEVLKKMKNPDEEYFKLTDESPRYAFHEYLESKNLEYDKRELKKIVQDSIPVIDSLKRYHNRPRPSQVNPQIKAFNSKTAKSPAYPSGHALQSYLIAKHLSKKYPFRTYQFYSIADRIANARISYGLHYPSDNSYAKELAEKM